MDSASSERTPGTGWSELEACHLVVLLWCSAATPQILNNGVENAAPSGSEQQKAAESEQDNEDEGDDSASGGPLKPSPHGDTYLLFTKPQNFQSKLPAGKEVHFLVGFSNKGETDFVLDTMDASFRYPMDSTFYSQNPLGMTTVN